MSRLKEIKYFTLVMLLFGFVAAGSLSACRDQKKETTTEEQGEHPTEEGATDEEHPADNGATDEEHPSDDGAAKEEHPKN
ncbi:hypothetical protein SAMN05421636_104322 [Pricia antarctica]|uniref:Uncharacterized protein n=1 Tax=Pricia antarctica TaxID=641691 RepID=A0A1G7BYQ6_9FLAO|nr:hypothetical protein [Pricia antarctica]SDE31335.1 hypothetical protein SAMN05421636_104322 [Pricia antarctica]